MRSKSSSDISWPRQGPKKEGGLVVGAGGSPVATHVPCITSWCQCPGGAYAVCRKGALLVTGERLSIPRPHTLNAVCKVKGVYSGASCRPRQRSRARRGPEHQEADIWRGCTECCGSPEEHHVSTNKNYRGRQVKATLHPKGEWCEDQEPFRPPAAILGAPGAGNHLDNACFQPSIIVILPGSVEVRATQPAIGLHKPFHPHGRREIREMRLARDDLAL